MDHSILELFVNDGAATVTRRAYPTLADATAVGLYADGAPCVFEAVTVWQLDAAPVEPPL